MAELVHVPKNKSDFQEKCLEQKILLIEGEVNSQMKDYILSSLLILKLSGSPDIEIYFNSNGGETRQSCIIYNALKLYTGKKTAIIIDKAHSSATTILQSCDVRKISKYSKTNIHYGQRKVNASIFISDEEIREERINAEEIKNTLEEILMSKAKISLPELQAILIQDKYLSSDEMLKIGLVDEII